MQQQHIVQNRKEIPCTHFFLYRKKQYPFNFELFKISSDYFIANEDKIIDNKYIKLLDEAEEEKIDIKEDIINNFIQYINRQPIPLNNENVAILHYLAHKYELPELIGHTEEYISTHHSEIALDQLIIHDVDNNIDNKIYEDIISSHLLDYINDERIFCLKFPIIYRIVVKYQTEEQNSIPTEKMNEFLFKCLDKYGREASILFENADIGKLGNENIRRLFKDYSEIFDFHFINLFYTKTLYDTQNELFCLLKKQENEMIALIEDVKSTLSEQQIESKRKEEELLNEIKSIKSALSKQQIESKKKEEELLNEIKSIKSALSKQQIESKKKEEELLNEIKSIKSTLSKQQIESKKKEEELLNEIKSIKSTLSEQHFQKEKEKSVKGTEINFTEGKLAGIFDYLRKNSNIDDEVSVSKSSDGGGKVSELLQIENPQFTYYGTSNEPNSWICFEFKNRQIRPNKYTVRGYKGWGYSWNPKEWIIEGSYDNNEWTKLDEQKNCTYLDQGNFIHTFSIENKNSSFYKFLRILQTGPNCSNNHYFYICSIEFYGELI